MCVRACVITTLFLSLSLLKICRRKLRFIPLWNCLSLFIIYLFILHGRRVYILRARARVRRVCMRRGEYIKMLTFLVPMVLFCFGAGKCIQLKLPDGTVVQRKQIQ